MKTNRRNLLENYMLSLAGTLFIIFIMPSRKSLEQHVLRNLRVLLYFLQYKKLWYIAWYNSKGMINWSKPYAEFFNLHDNRSLSKKSPNNRYNSNIKSYNRESKAVCELLEEKNKRNEKVWIFALKKEKTS